MDVGMNIPAAIVSDGEIMKVGMAVGVGFVQGTVRGLKNSRLSPAG
jgi:hypothetical protein